MSQSTRRAPGRPKKAQTESAQPTAVAKQKAPKIKRKDVDDKAVAQVYEIPKGGGVAYMIPQRGVTVYDSEKDTVREMR